MSIALEQVSKHYDGAAAVNDVSVSITDGEFFVLLGPSGSGKSTLLRAIAGLTTIDHGRIVLNGRDVSNVSPREREVGFVFQNYALFRHMTIADNIEFALRARRVPAKLRRQRRAELLKLVSLEGFDRRLPSELSGGQQQRVAVARALAHEPRVLLLDEPFGALDARIRDDLRRGIRDIQRAVGITTILVTHDQEEAFTMADRIGVMDRGRLQEVGEPRVLYARPKTRFVATFLGAANLLLGHRERNGMRIGESLFRLDRIALPPPSCGTEATVVIRPEDIVVARSDVRAAAHPIGSAEVVEMEFVGSLERIRLSVEANPLLQSALKPDAPVFSMEASRSARESETAPLIIGQKLCIGVKRIHVLSTRISSLRLLGTRDEAELRLKKSKLVSDLAMRMHITPTLHPAYDAGKAPLAGLPVVELDEGHGLQIAARLLQDGASQVLIVGSDNRPAERLLIYAQPSRPARDSVLSTAGSLLRHMSVDSTLLVPADERSLYGARYRDLLDIRNAALQLHGVDVRTESFREGIADELRVRLRSAPSTMLLIGMTSSTSGSALIEALAALTKQCRFAAVLVTCARSDTESLSVRHVREGAVASFG
ncbi:MAG: ABC transporter ATP-binding protein [Woeseia sp.]